MAGRSSKSKGYRGEVEVIGILAEIMREEYERAGLGPAPELSRSPAGRDIRGIPWISIEVKRHEPALNSATGVRRDEFLPSQVEGWWTQCKTNTLSGQESVLIYRKNHSPWQVRMFGKLHTQDAAIRCPVDITIEAFCLWFRVRLRESLKVTTSA